MFFFCVSGCTVNDISSFLSLHNALSSKNICLNDSKEEIRTQLKFYSNLLEKIGNIHHLLNKKICNYEVLLL